MPKGDMQKCRVRKIPSDRARKKTLQLAAPGNCAHLYAATFADAGASLIYISDESGHHNFYRMNLSNFERLQLTDSATVFSASACYSEHAREIFFWSETALTAVNIDTLAERTVYDAGYQGGRLSASADGRLVAFAAACEDVPGFSEEFAGRYALMLVSARGEGAHPVLTTPFVIGRVEASPTDPDVLAYSWAGRWEGIPQRMWWTDASGLEGGPLGYQNPNEIRGGAFFAASGRVLGYHGSKHHIRSTDAGYFVEETGWLVGLMDSDGGDERQFYCPGPTGRCRVSSRGDTFVCDVGGAFVPEHESISLVHLEDEKGVFVPLFFFGVNRRGDLRLPRPQFSPDDSTIVFTAESNGISSIHLTSLA